MQLKRGGSPLCSAQSPSGPPFLSLALSCVNSDRSGHAKSRRWGNRGAIQMGRSWGSMPWMLPDRPLRGPGAVSQEWRVAGIPAQTGSRLPSSSAGTVWVNPEMWGVPRPGNVWPPRQEMLSGSEGGRHGLWKTVAGRPEGAATEMEMRPQAWVWLSIFVCKVGEGWRVLSDFIQPGVLQGPFLVPHGAQPEDLRFQELATRGRLRTGLKTKTPVCRAHRGRGCFSSSAPSLSNYRPRSTLPRALGVPQGTRPLKWSCYLPSRLLYSPTLCMGSLSTSRIGLLCTPPLPPPLSSLLYVLPGP